MDNMLTNLIQQYSQQPWWVSVAEWVTLIFGIWSVWLGKKQHVGIYPVGLVATTITMWLLYRVGFWGDMLVNFYFSVMSIYGWIKWASPVQNGDTLAPSYLNKRESFIGFGLFILTLILIFAVYKFFGTPMDWSHIIDLLSAGIFFTAMYFMALKKIENWILWFIGDLIVLPIYAYRGLYLLTIQYAIFTLLAVLAYREWRKAMQVQPAN